MNRCVRYLDFNFQGLLNGFNLDNAFLLFMELLNCVLKLYLQMKYSK